MKTYTIPAWMTLGTPRACQGQIIERSYGIDMQSGVVVCKSYDRSDRATTWMIAEMTDAEMEALESYDAGGANEAPTVEAEWVEVSVRHEL